MVEQTVLFSAPNEIVRDLLDNRFRPLVITRMSAALGRPINFAVVVRPTPDPDVVPEEPPSEQAKAPAGSPPSAAARSPRLRRS